MDLTNKTELLSYLKSNGLWAKHGLGQNFLVDREALDKIIEAGDIQPDDLIIEVGPGVGTLTEELASRAGKVIAVELDQKMAHLLEQMFHCSTVPLLGGGSNEAMKQSNNGLSVINQDILKINLNELVGDKPYKVVANIPYYITSKILQAFLTLKNKPESIVLLVQKEVAERICAKPGGMSILAISVQVFGEPEIVGIVPKESFFPAPKVDSAILLIKNIHHFNSNTKHEIRNTKQIINPKKENSKSASDFEIRNSDLQSEKKFFQIVHIGFSAKRKTLANNLSNGYRMDKKITEDIIKSIGLSANARAQELSLDDWKKLSENIK